MGSAILRGSAIGLVLLAILLAVLDRAGLATITLPHAGGPAAWHLARATGFTAFVALGLDVTLGLLLSTRGVDRWMARGDGVGLHRWLSPIALALTLGHAAVLLADGFVRFDALDVLVPFVAPYRPLAVGLGVIALYATVVVHTSFALRKRIGARAWRRLHYLSFVAFAAAAAHALLAGTDASRPWALAVIAAPTAAIAALVTTRLRGKLT